MISKYSYKNLTWVDLESPTEEELLHVMEAYSLPAVVGEEMKNSSIQSKVDLYPNFIYTILHFPQVSHKDKRGVEKEIDFIVGKDFIITTHYEYIETIHEFSKTFEVNTMLERYMEMEHAGFIFYHLTKKLYIHSRHQLNDINNLLKDTEKKIFEGKEGEMVTAISQINRTLLDFKQALRFHREVLNSFDMASKKFFGEPFTYYTSNVIGEYNKTHNILDGHKEVLNDLRDTNDSLLSTKTNQTIKVLTVLTFLITPITVISNIFVINSSFLRQESTRPYNYVLVLMLITSILALVYVKLKKWL